HSHLFCLPKSSSIDCVRRRPDSSKRARAGTRFAHRPKVIQVRALRRKAMLRRRLLGRSRNDWVCVTITLSVFVTGSIIGLHEVRPSYVHTDGTTSVHVNFSRGMRSAQTEQSTPNAATKMGLSRAYGQLPLYFEANRGQTDHRVKFLSRGASHTLFLTPTEPVLVMSKAQRTEAESRRRLKGVSESPLGVTQTVLRMRFMGANARSPVVGRERFS